MPKETNESSLRNKLDALLSYGALSQSLSHTDSDSEFQILEFYGDAVLNQRVSLMLMQTRRFMGPGGLTRLRSECVCNSNLAKVFDMLKVAEMMGEDKRPPNSVKDKADIMEAIIGELSEGATKPELHKYHDEIDRTISALLNFVAYIGEQNYTIQQAIEQASQKDKEMTRNKTPPKTPHQHKPHYNDTPKNNKRHPSPQHQNGWNSNNSNKKKKNKDKKKQLSLGQVIKKGSQYDPILLEEEPVSDSSPPPPLEKTKPVSAKEMSEMLITPESIQMNIIPPEPSEMPKGATWEELCSWSKK